MVRTAHHPPGHVEATLGADDGSSGRRPAVKQRLMAWLNHLEGKHRYFLTPNEMRTWATPMRAPRDACSAREEARAEIGVAALGDGPTGCSAPIELVLLGGRRIRRRTRSPAGALGARAHYFLHPWHEPDLDALARPGDRAGVGLVLGVAAPAASESAGARARELEIPDPTSSAAPSMGAFIAALMASGLGPVEMVQIEARRSRHANHLNDYTLPRVSLIRGRKFSALRQVFGEDRIEDLRGPTSVSRRT